MLIDRVTRSPRTNYTKKQNKTKTRNLTNHQLYERASHDDSTNDP